MGYLDNYLTQIGFYLLSILSIFIHCFGHMVHQDRRNLLHLTHNYMNIVVINISHYHLQNNFLHLNNYSPFIHLNTF